MRFSRLGSFLLLAALMGPSYGPAVKGADAAALPATDPAPVPRARAPEQTLTVPNRFEGFPKIGVFRPGKPTSSPITSDLVPHVLRPKWTRAMGDLGGWPHMYRFRGRIHLSFPHLDAHRGKRLEATGGQVDYVSDDEGRTWRTPENAMPKAMDVVVTRDTIYFYAYRSGLANQVCTSTDGKTFGEWQDAYKAPFCMWGVMFDPASKLFWAAPHAIPKTREQGARQVHFVNSKDGVHWDYLSTIHANQEESESIVRFEPDRTAVVLIRQKWGPQASWVATAKPPYKEWTVADRPDTLGGHHFVEIGGQTFVPTRAALKGESAESKVAPPSGSNPTYYSAIFHFSPERTLVPWAVMDSMGDCSYPQLVETPTEILCAYYSQHEDGVCKVFLAGYDKQEFLRGP
jgi:hypothetical protein